MSVGFFKRLMSSVVDITLVITVVIVTFLLIGRPLLQKRIDNFNEIYTSYTNIITVYNDDLQAAQTEYNANMTNANGNADKEAAAQALYTMKLNALKAQNNIDLEPYNLTISKYYYNIIHYYIIGFLALMTVYTLVVKGKTLGRKLLQIKLDGNVNLSTIFFHDIMLKYFFLLLLMAFSLYYAFIFLVLSFAVDLLLITFTRNKTTLRDMLLKIKVVKTNYGY
jgi:hypothetical protein